MSSVILSLDSTIVRQIDGLYSLNDVHKASGGQSKHEPNYFVRLDTTQCLIEEISKSPDVGICIKSQRGINGGTWACRELVIAYASWISAAFHLKVIRVFLNAIQPTANLLPSIDPNNLEPLKQALIACGVKLPSSEKSSSALRVAKHRALKKEREDLAKNLSLNLFQLESFDPVRAIERIMPYGSHIKMMKMPHCDAMSGTIESGDMVFVDCKVNRFAYDSVYLIETPYYKGVYRLQRMRHHIKVIRDNPFYPAELLADHEIKVIGEVLGKLSVTELSYQGVPHGMRATTPNYAN